MSSKGSGGAPPKYLNDFSKALAGEVRILLQEVGKLRDERRALQYEIAELMALKSKHGAGGEYTPDWKPTHDEPAPPPSPGPPPPPASVVGDAPARPAWRVVNKREERRQKAKAKALPPPEPIPQPEPTRAPNLPAWAQWRRPPTPPPK
ncbi:predicted protein [Postia placenta Mad-698-R]|uniref:Uncharacterized protein n=2 Tax=Rhodonia placenta TaxID=104341 RepID=A0A1X6MKS0_9APHY|nr:hypothetical protein POSPLADRAFT_1158805 [Postia placenta MAD-698-R-SB12]EED79345.1 predicted protein [Postia placenta Mad-698-R]EED81340.1 predicted protein [Postia placenta Mad-698-R]KAF9815217.1 hypothetical protein IEO21_04734 [Postia placenta]OSX56836.1 hypothetical protein POSPLADRAFT_1158805 [Postia placenta MAD-698-R-SB12]